MRERERKRKHVNKLKRFPVGEEEGDRADGRGKSDRRTGSGKVETRLGARLGSERGEAINRVCPTDGRRRGFTAAVGMQGMEGERERRNESQEWIEKGAMLWDEMGMK